MIQAMNMMQGNWVQDENGNPVCVNSLNRRVINEEPESRFHPIKLTPQLLRALRFVLMTEPGAVSAVPEAKWHPYFEPREGYSVKFYLKDDEDYLAGQIVAGFRNGEKRILLYLHDLQQNVYFNCDEYHLCFLTNKESVAAAISPYCYGKLERIGKD